jgi:hypothetical protein
VALDSGTVGVAGAAATLLVGTLAAVLSYRGSGRRDVLDGLDRLRAAEREFYTERLRQEQEEAAEATERAVSAEARARLLEHVLREHGIADPEDRRRHDA